MGIYDRDYARAGARPGAAAGGFVQGRLRRLTFVHWLIIVNVAVFVLDALLGARGVLIPVHMGDFFRPDADPTRMQLLVQHPPERPPRGLMAEMPIRDRASGEIVGRRVYRWMPPMTAWGHFSTAKGFLSLEVWRLVTFQFLHADVTHLALNMLALYFFGPLVEERLRTKKRFAAYYLVCGICGALLYLTLNLLGFLLGARVPGLLFDDMHTPLIGASAGVFGVLMASAYIAGDGIMLVFMVLPMKIRTGAYLMLAIALLNLLSGGSNAGGDAAHVGGALAGFFFIRNMHLLGDFFEVLGPGERKTRAWRRAAARADAERLDAVLDKVRERGLHSLTEDEQDILRRATREKREA